MGFLALKKTFNPQNIYKGFKTIRIWPLNLETMLGKMQPSKKFMDTKNLICILKKLTCMSKGSWENLTFLMTMSIIILLKLKGLIVT